MNVQLGDEVQDSVSGYRGIAVSITSYLNGCARVGVQTPVGKDGKLAPYEAFDEPNLKVLKRAKVKIGDQTTGGPSKYMPKERRP